MRIIAGAYKGRILSAPKIDGVRPTQDRVKEALFDIIKLDVEGSDVLELFAGTGSLGIEALSRGAKSVTFIDRHPLCIKTIEENLESLKISYNVIRRPLYSLTRDSSNRAEYDSPQQKEEIDQATVIKTDIFKAIKYFSEKSDKFGIVIADPPYGTDHARKLLIKLDTCDIIKQPFLVIIEHSIDYNIPQKEGNIILLKQYNYGDTILSVYRKSL